jgi:hypothetical protein
VSRGRDEEDAKMTKANVKATQKILSQARAELRNAKTEEGRRSAEIVIDECEKNLANA